LEIPLDHGFNEKFGLSKLAANHARDIHAMCTDVAAIIFPKALNPPTDAIISAVSTKLIQLVSDLEKRLISNVHSRSSITWEILASSGFLREPDLIDFTLARVAEDHLESCLEFPIATFVTKLLDHSDSNIADSAQTLLAAESLHRFGSGNSFLGLSPELLHKLCWRVVAALEIVNGGRNSEIIAATKSLISQYSEADRAMDAARKIVHFAHGAELEEFLHPDVAGLRLHVAALSAHLELDYDHVLHLLNAQSSAPYALMLAACAVEKDHAIRNMLLFSGNRTSAHDFGIFEASYAEITRESAFEEIGYWAAERSQYLASGKTT
jgi:hypothetical protein